jgi:mRNA interferase RelE/StbE
VTEQADSDGPYELIVASSASYALSEVLPEGAAWAVIEFINGRLLDNPHRLGAPLHGALEGLYSAHVDDYRVVYDIDDEARTVEVVRVARRADIYGIT